MTINTWALVVQTDLTDKEYFPGSDGRRINVPTLLAEGTVEYGQGLERRVAHLSSIDSLRLL